jgi:cell division protein FtsB
VACLTARVNVDLGIWNKLTKLVIGLLLVAGLLGVGVWYLPLIKQNERMRREVQRLDTQIEKEEDWARRLKASVEAMRNDPKAVERLARQLGYAKPGETVIRFEDSPTNSVSLR